jgi:hypothetical protein
MGIDIYARWRGSPTEPGELGYLHEAYHGEPYATRFLVYEAFLDGDGAFISAATLRERLPETLRLAKERERKVYGARPKAKMRATLQSFTDFVELCERMEKKTKKPVLIVARW